MADASKNQPVFALLLASAQQDLAACQLLAASPEIGDAIVGFHAQQAVEKSLKAVLSANITNSIPMQSRPVTAPSIRSG